VVALVPLSPRGIVLIVAVLAAVLGVVAETIVLLADLEAGPCGERAIKSEMPVVIVSARAGCVYDTLLHKMTDPPQYIANRPWQILPVFQGPNGQGCY